LLKNTLCIVWLAKVFLIKRCLACVAKREEAAAQA
jgi:hypothetical protein